MDRPMLSLEQAQARLLALATPLPPENAGIEDALGRYLAEPLLARRTQPAADMSAMDGYAVHSEDLGGPWRVVGESAAGHPYAGPIRAGEAVRISTGALIPDGADAVICQEDVARTADDLTLTGTPPNPANKHIRRAGFDFAEGAALLPQGIAVGPVQIALALAAGHSHLPVRRRPRIAILDSGDELARSGAPCPPHRIPASNGAMLSALVAQIPCHVHRLGPVADDMDALAEALAAAGEADLIVTTGGASVGDHDLIRPALVAWGAEIDFWKVAIKPGKPMMVAKRGAQVVLGLPGNPVASMVTGHFFLLPLLRHVLGAALCAPRRVMAQLAEPVPAGSDRREFLRGAWDGAQVFPSTMRDSSALASLAHSNCLIDRPIGAPALPAGAQVMIYLLHDAGFA